MICLHNFKLGLRMKKLKQSLFISLIFISACTKNTSELFSNCKLPIADGRGGVAIGGFPRYSERLRSTGTVNVTFLMVDFPDSVATMSVATAYAKVSGAKQFFSDMSYSKMNYNMSAPSSSWIRMPKASTQYSFGTYQNHIAYVRDAVTAADSTVDFSNTDSLVIIQNPDTTSISSIGPSMALSAGQGVTADGKEMLNIVTSGNDINVHGYLWLNHEVTHTLGLVDLYSSSPASSSFHDSLPYTGGFSLMGLSSISAMFAPSMLAWERYVLGWIDDSQVTCVNPRKDGEATALLAPINTTGGMKALIVPVGQYKVVVIESRRRQNVDANLTKEGALVYSVDSSIQSGKGPIKVFPTGSEADPWFAQSPRSAGESVIVEGIKVEVLSSNSEGDTVKVSGDKIQIDKK